MTFTEFAIRQIPNLIYSLVMAVAVTLIARRLDRFDIEGTI